MITIKPFDSTSYDVTQMGNVHESKIEKLMDLLHENYPGQTTVVLEASYPRVGSCRVAHFVEEKALALAGLTGYAAAKAAAAGQIVF